ncbi:hypothetical protein QTJ16_006305 [Diplocarpon rosae]|uniref:USP domain-containing protein n=1 Tax=Diplocarpon rosae TaxID=946125 RepID=A0AAD9SVB0_9HELO|nr:hypothetical protein QTJ16_006305 [Diplocarpon rosae]PBP28027.1 hypothetical protein BUE80_DR000979 [Diplocarpon rosae]
MAREYFKSVRSPPKLPTCSLSPVSQKIKHRPLTSNKVDHKASHSLVLKQPTSLKSSSKTPLSKKLPLRSRHSEVMSSSYNPRRDRERRANDDRCGNRQGRRSSSEPMAATGLETFEVLAKHSLKRGRDQGTQTDLDQYAKRVKLEVVSSTNTDMLTERCQQSILKYFIRGLSKPEKDALAKLRFDWTRMPAFSQQGMCNHTGAICYRLSLLQSLLHIPVFVNWVMDSLAHVDCLADHRLECLSCALHKLATAYWAKSSLLAPLKHLDNVLKKLGWAADVSSGHGDPDEHAVKMFQILESELPTTVFSQLDLMTHWKYSSGVQCRACGHKSSTPNNRSHTISVKLQPKRPTLSGYIDDIMEDTASGYKCDLCKKSGIARRYQEITYFPEILSINLERIDHNGDKNMSQPSIPISLDLNKYRSHSEISGLYELSAVVKHAGSGQYGHYTCSARGPDGKWNKYDDSDVFPSTAAAAVRNEKRMTPYILYYQKKRA